MDEEPKLDHFQHLVYSPDALIFRLRHISIDKQEEDPFLSNILLQAAQQIELLQRALENEKRK